MEAPEPNTPPSSVGMTIIGVILTILVFIFVSIIGTVAFGIFDNARGLGDSRLQEIFRQLFVPGMGGYLAISVVDRWVARASIQSIFFVLAAFLLVCAGIYIGLVVPYASHVETHFGAILVDLLSLASGIVGAYIAAKTNLSISPTQKR